MALKSYLVILQDTKGVGLYGDTDRCHSLILLDNWLQSIVELTHILQHVQYVMLYMYYDIVCSGGAEHMQSIKLRVGLMDNYCLSKSQDEGWQSNNIIIGRITWI